MKYTIRWIQDDEEHVSMLENFGDMEVFVVEDENGEQIAWAFSGGSRLALLCEMTEAASR